MNRCPSCGAESDRAGVTFHTTMCSMNPDSLQISGGDFRITPVDQALPDPITMGILRNLVAMHYVVANQLRHYDQQSPAMHDIVQTVLGRFTEVIWPAGTADALVAGLSEDLS